MTPARLAGFDVVVDGVRLHVVDYGRGTCDGPGQTEPPGATDPAIVLLGGPFTDPALWTEVVRDLGRAHRVVVPDLVGLGESEAPTGAAPYGPGLQARRLLALLDRLGVDRFVAVGHDLGGTVAVQLASTAPDRVRGLGLVATPLHQAKRPEAHEPRAGVVRHALHAFAARRPADRVRGRLRFLRAVDLAGAERTLEIIAGTPLLVLWGEQDEVRSPAYGRRLAAALDGAWVPVADAGHRLPGERPERVAEELHAFVTGLRPAEAGVSTG